MSVYQNNIPNRHKKLVSHPEAGFFAIKNAAEL